MQRASLLIVGSVVAVFLLGAAPQPQAGGRTQTGDHSQKIVESLERLAAAQEKAVKPSEIEKRCDPATENRDSDLCAQWKAADAASDAARWAMLGFWASLATIAALALTIWQSHRGLRMAQESLGAQERPWLEVELTVSNFRTGISAAGENGYRTNVNIRLINRGKSPAHQHNVAVEMVYQQPEAAAQHNRSIQPRSSLIFTEHSVRTGLFIPPEFFVPSRPDRPSPFIVGHVNYTSPYVRGVMQTSFVYALLQSDGAGEFQMVRPDSPNPVVAVLVSGDAT